MQKENIFCYSNTGGFGIDGCLSSAIGSSLSNQNKEVFCVIGDLSFFYDINALYTKNVGNNLHILLINNGLGTEFKNYNHKAAVFGEQTDAYVAAAGHNGHKSKVIVRDFATGRGFRYISANDWTSFDANVKNFLSTSNNPVIFEVFTSSFDESNALKQIHLINGKPKYRTRLKRILLKLRKMIRK